MKNKKTKSLSRGKTRDNTFTFDPAKLNISGLYVTAIFNGGGHETARLFANSNMRSRLLLNYNYSVNKEDFPDESEAEIKTIVATAAEQYFRDVNQLRIYEAASPEADITANDWQRHYEGNGLLVDLDRPSLASKTDLSTGVEKTGNTDTINLIFTCYVTPPPGTATTYTLLARYRYTDDDGDHSEDSNAVTLTTQLFSIDTNDMQMEYVASTDDSRSDTQGYCNLFALSYIDDTERFGMAVPANITTYEGIVLDSNQYNICMTHVGSDNARFAGFYYYPSSIAKDQLRVGEYGGNYGQEIDHFTYDYVYYLCSSNTESKSAWDWIEHFTPIEVNDAHNRGIPTVMVVNRNGFSLHQVLHMEGSDHLYGPLRTTFNYDNVYYRMEDNCGNTMEVKIDWHPRSWEDNDRDPFKIKDVRKV